MIKIFLLFIFIILYFGVNSSSAPDDIFFKLAQITLIPACLNFAIVVLRYSKSFLLNPKSLLPRVIKI